MALLLTPLRIGPLFKVRLKDPPATGRGTAKNTLAEAKITFRMLPLSGFTTLPWKHFGGSHILLLWGPSKTRKLAWPRLRCRTAAEEAAVPTAGAFGTEFKTSAASTTRMILLARSRVVAVTDRPP